MTSTVPAAVVNLYNAFAAAVDGTTIPHFGEPMENVEGPEHVSVAYTPGTTESIDTSSEWASLGFLKQEERYEVPCALVVWSGDDSEAAILTAFLRAYAIYDQLTAALADDYTLANAVREAHISSHATTVEQTDRGAAVTLSFRVACAARVTH